MKTRTILSFLALGVFGVAPAFADHLSSNPQGFFQDSSNGRNLALGPFNEKIFAPRPISFEEQSRLSVANELFGTNRGEDKREGRPFVIAFNHGHAFGRDDDRDRGKHEPIAIGGDFPSPEVAVPEPASFTLLLLGLGAMGIFLYRRTP